MLCAGTAAAEAPLSAIDWLSDSVQAPVVAPGGTAGVARPGDATVPQVTSRPLAAQLPDAAGLIPADAAGLDRDLWRGSTSAAIARLLARIPADLLPASRDLLKRVLLAELTPPGDADSRGLLLEARVDALLSLGALEEAAALLDLVEAKPPGLFRRYFDVALLGGRDIPVCRQLERNPAFTPTYPARIYCLAQTGDWATAAMTLDTALALGLLGPNEAEPLEWFLHPELSEEFPDPVPPARPSPLVFRLFAAFGAAVPTGTLPLAYAHADLQPEVGWNAQLDAAERLTRAGALDPNRLFGLYTERRPSASGGVWERVKAVQALDAALDGDDAGAVSAALIAARDAFDAAGLAPVLAALFVPRLAPLTGLSPAAERARLDLALLTRGYRLAALGQTADDPDTRFLIAIALGRAGETPAPGERAFAIREGFAAPLDDPEITQALAGGRRGEALIEALLDLRHSEADANDRIRRAIGLLRALGFEDTARRAALELMLLGDER